MTTAAMGLLLVCSSCATSLRHDQTVQTPTDTPAVNAHYVVDSHEPATSQPGPASSAGPESAIQQLDYEAWSAAPVEQVQYAVPSPLHSPGPVYDPTDCPGEFLPADPRVTLPTESLSLEHCPAPWARAGEFPLPVYEPDVYPEEYICDGGDRGLKVYHNFDGRQGLETEDTVAEYTDDCGERHIRPSSRTCIYAPQFAAVRSASLPHENLAVGKLAGAHDHRPTVGLRSQLTPAVELHNDQPIGLDRRSRASGIDSEMAGSSVAQVAAATHHIKLNNVFESRLFLGRDQLDHAELAYLSRVVQQAASWTCNLNPVIIATDAAGQEVVAEFHPEEYVEYEDRSCKGDLRIIKLVDKPAGVPGDVVTFTIRYENIGDRDLYRILIVDNLTPRLELLPESTQSDREGRFSIEDNNEGSSVLTFELADPLPGKTGGTLTFQCRVR